MLNSGTQLELNELWTVVAPLNADGGGFGDLYVVRNAPGDEAVAKLVKKDPGAERELFIGTAVAAAKYPNVMPVIDDGEHEDEWVLVMPLAEKSLAAHLAAEGPLDPDQVVSILRDLARALAGIDGAIVHRDVKPPNILFYQGSWCLTDFGISKYAEATTADETRKGFMSRPYAAPEQWRYERATSATDVYALGCVAFELLTGAPPFSGPDYRQQHLNETPPDLQVGTARLRVLIEECLFKAASARPAPENILKKLDKMADEPASGGLAVLAEANRSEVRRKTVAQAQFSAEQVEQERREELHQTAVQAFRSIGAALLDAINDVAPTAVLNDPRISMAMSPRPDLLSVGLNEARLGVTKPYRSQSVGAHPFTVVSEAVIMLMLPRMSRSGWAGRSHSLWFCDAHVENQFSWYETAFMTTPLMSSRSVIEPYHQSAEGANEALSPVMGVQQVAWPFDELDRSDLSEFVDRWLGWFGAAAQGTLSKSSMMPERPTAGTWRTGAKPAQ